MHDIDVEGKGGEFFLYPNEQTGELVRVKPETNSGIMVDGSQVIHGTTEWMPPTKPPIVDKDDKKEL